MPRLGIRHLVTADCGGNGEGNAIIQLMKISIDEGTIYSGGKSMLYSQ